MLDWSNGPAPIPNRQRFKGSTRLNYQESGEADWQEYVLGRESPADPNSSRNAQATDDLREKESHTRRMSEITREELDAKLAATEARMDARLEKFDKDMRQVVSDFRLEVQPLKSLKTNIWSSTAFIIASVIAVASLSFGAFDSGRETSKLVEEAKQQATENRKLLEQIDSKLRAIPAQPSAFQGTERTEKAPSP